MHNVIVTGGSRGLGLAIASTLATAGYRAIAIARTESPELSAAAAKDGIAGQLLFRGYDLSQIQGLGPLVAGIRREFGPIYGLVNNAGLGTSGILTTTDDQKIVALVSMNTVVPILMAKYSLRSMMVARTGRIINISSIVSHTGYSGLSAYAATKSSMLGFTRSLAREVGSLGITVNSVCPGFADTEMTSQMDDKIRQKITRRSALKRLIEPADVAAIVEFLMSDKAHNITGTNMTVDAGSTA